MDPMICIRSACDRGSTVRGLGIWGGVLSVAPSITDGAGRDRSGRAATRCGVKAAFYTVPSTAATPSGRWMMRPTSFFFPPNEGLQTQHATHNSSRVRPHR
eukprot:1849136-Prymnesium_polylepis.1